MNTEHRGGDAPWTAHVVADSDTRWKWGSTVATRLRPGLRIEGHLLRGRATPNERQVADIGGADGGDVHVRRVGIVTALDELADTDAELVVLACVGGGNQALLQGLSRAWAGRERRPVVVTGYVGLVYEGLVDGLLLRAGADVLLANSAHDAREFRAVLTAVGADPEAVVATALPFLADLEGADDTPAAARHDPTAAGRTRPFTITFVAQPSVPAELAQRRYLIEQVVEHAQRHPERQVVLKLRGRPGEQTTHPEPYHYAKLLARRGTAPDNLEVAYGAMADVLDRTDLCVTVSSTAALEAIHRDIPTAVLTDFGVRESLGNHAFLGAGVYASWPELHDGAVPKPDPDWAADHGVGHAGDTHAEARTRVAALVAAREQLPPLRPWLDTDRAGGYLPALLARNGLAADGGPLVGSRWSAQDAGVARRAVRRGARELYQVSLKRVEPHIRKWAQL